MDEQTKQELGKKLLSYLGTLEEALKQGGDMLAEQTPLAVQEYLTWHFWHSALLACVFAVSAGCLAWLSQKAFRHMGGVDSVEAGVGRILLALFAPVAVFGLVCGAVDTASTALQVAIAPRVFLLERIAEMVK